MNRAVSRSFKDAGSEAREAAEEAARRQRMSLSEWLDTVITEQAEDTAPAPFGGREPRYRGPAPERLREPDRGAREDVGAGPRVNGRTRRRDGEDHVSEPRFRQRSSRHRSRHDDYPDDRDDRRGRRPSRLDDMEVMLEDTLESVERSVAKAQRRTEIALADLAGLLQVSGAEHDASRAVVTELDGRLKTIEGQLRAPSAPAPRLRAVPLSSEAAVAAQAHEPAPLTDVQRLEAKLNTVLAAVTARKPEPRSPAPAHLIQTAVGEIAERQRELSKAAALGPLAARLQHRSGTLPADRSETAIALAQLHHGIVGLAAKLDDVKRDFVAPAPQRTGEEALARIRDEIAVISQGLAASSLNPEAVARIQSQTEEIRNLLATASAHPLPFERVEKEIAALTRQLERATSPLGGGAQQTAPRSAAELRSLIQETSEPALDDIRARIDTLTGKVSEAIERASGERQFAELSRRLDSVQAKIAGVAPEGGDAQSIASMVGSLAETLEAARQPQAGLAAIDQLQAQISRIAERLDRTDSTFDAIASLQSSVSELFAELETKRRAGEQAADTLAQGGAKGTSLDQAIAMEIAELRSLQDQADRRSHATLSAVHATLQKVVERLARLEDHTDGPGPETLALGPAPVFAPAPQPKTPATPKAKSDGGFVANLLRSRSAAEDVETPRPAPVVEDVLIEPGMAAPHVGRRPPAPEVDIGVEPDVGMGRNNFIAAARRAAQTAQREAEGLDGRSGAKTGSAAADRSPRRGLDGRKRLIVLSLAALFVLAGAYAVLRSQSPAVPQKAAAVSAPAVTKRDSQMSDGSVPRSAEADVAALSPTTPANADAVPTQAGTGTDPIVVSSIPVKPAAPAVSAPPLLAGPPGAASGANLRTLADAGSPSAQYEMATRYAEGRMMPRDLKLSAQWYEKAALQGLAPAEYRLGSMYEKGLGVGRDLVRAKMWYQKAADQGNARAMHNLAVLTAEGSDNKPDYAGAASWFRKAAELGVRDSQYNLAILLARGLGQPVNLVQSYVWFAAAAAQGDEDAGKKRDDIGARLDSKDLAAAKAIATAFRPTPLDPLANEVAPPPGGWDSTVPPAAGVKATKPKISVL